MESFFDKSSVIYVVLALIPNLFLMLWVMARMHKQVRLVHGKLSLVEADNKNLTEVVRDLSNEILRLRQAQPEDPPVPSEAFDGDVTREVAG